MQQWAQDAGFETVGLEGVHVRWQARDGELDGAKQERVHVAVGSRHWA